MHTVFLQIFNGQSGFHRPYVQLCFQKYEAPTILFGATGMHADLQRFRKALRSLTLLSGFCNDQKDHLVFLPHTSPYFSFSIYVL